MPERSATGRKETVRSRARGLCEYCRSQERFATESFSVEHIVPLQAGGEGLKGLENLAFACQGCNNHKYTKTDAVDPVSGNVVPLFHPRHDRWREHFIWNHDFTLIIGLTAVGRATVEVLQLNRPGLINLRWALYRCGEHPPVDPYVKASPQE